MTLEQRSLARRGGMPASAGGVPTGNGRRGASGEKVRVAVGRTFEREGGVIIKNQATGALVARAGG